MNQEQIGKFIAKCRKQKNLTQQQLASKLGVSDRTIGNWENGRNMPDLSLFKPLCDELEITINELLCGEKLTKKATQLKNEETLIKTINYGNQIIKEKNNVIGIILIVFGILISFTAMTIFASESSWGSIYAVLGGIISLVGIAKFTKRFSHGPRLIINFSYFIVYILLLLVIDYVGVVTLDQAPRFCYSKTTTNNIIKYQAPWYDVYRINYDTKNEYYLVDQKKEYTEKTVPNVPFNRARSGIANIIKYKSQYIGDNSNTGNLINNLPLAEYGYTFEIKPEEFGLIINYHITDWYINDNYYLEKSIIYNTVSIFALIDNTKYIQFNFSGKTYLITRSTIENSFPGFDYIVRNGLDKGYFNEYLEKNINDNEYVTNLFKLLFIDDKIKQTKKIVVKSSNDEQVINKITTEIIIDELIILMGRSSKITGMINMDGPWWNLYLYDQDDELIYKFLAWGYNGYASCFGIDTKEYKLVGLDGKKFTKLISK